MKTIKTYLFALIFFFAGTGMLLSAPSPEKESCIPNCEAAARVAVQNQVNDRIGFPNEAKSSKGNGEVNFIFRLNESNKIEILDIYGDDEQLVEFVEKAVEGHRINFFENLNGKAYRMVIDFNPAI